MALYEQNDTLNWERVIFLPKSAVAGEVQAPCSAETPIARLYQNRAMLMRLQFNGATLALHALMAHF